jgi:hypothetical protein
LGSPNIGHRAWPTTFDRLGYPGIGGQIRFLDDFAASFD